MDALGAAGGLVLRDLALVVREHQVHAAAVDVELLAQVLLPHHRALQVPAREPFAPRGRPAHDMLRLRLLPEGEIIGGPLVGLSVEGPGAFHRGLQRPSGEDAIPVIPVVFLHVEIDGAVGLVGIARVQNGLDGLDLLDDVAGGARFDGRRLHVQEAHGLVIALRVGLDHLHGLQLLQTGLLCNLVLAFVGIVLEMAHVGDVPHITDLVAEMLQETEQDVVGHARTGMAQMGVAIDGGTAHIHPYMAGMDGNEEFLPACQGIGQIKVTHKKIRSLFRLRIYEFYFILTAFFATLLRAVPPAFGCPWWMEALVATRGFA